MTMVMVPVTIFDLRALVDDGRLDGERRGIAADDALADEFGVEPGEEAEAAALQLADVLGLTVGLAPARRQVLVAEVPASHLVWTAGVIATVQTPISIAQVLSFFTGTCDSALAACAHGLDVDAAWVLPGVQEMLAEHPLEWHDVGELATWLKSLDELVQP